MTTRPTSLAVVVPTLDEAERLPRLLSDLEALDAAVIVADGGSTDRTAEIAATHGACVVEAHRGRGNQLRAGARACDAEWLFFLHADTRLSKAAAVALTDFVRSAEEEEFAHFRFALAGDAAFYRFIELGQRLRERWVGLAYGDQGLVVSRALFERVGGYPEWPILEDVGMLALLEGVGRRRVLPEALVTSPRRYETRGRWRGWLENAAIISLYRAGVSPGKLASWFPRVSTAEAVRQTVIVFAKAPRRGYVKTRLAAEVGGEDAVRIYRAIGRSTVDDLRRRAARIVVYHDPPDRDALAEVRRWLGTDGVKYRPQRGRDLGERMAHALEESLSVGHPACIVGTDIPGIGHEIVTDAFAALVDADVVVGPATDGGYYLVALRRPLPELFNDVPWSTPDVLRVTLERAARLGARVRLLEPKRDVDTGADVPPELLTA